MAGVPGGDRQLVDYTSNLLSPCAVFDGSLNVEQSINRFATQGLALPPSRALCRLLHPCSWAFVAAPLRAAASSLQSHHVNPVTRLFSPVWFSSTERLLALDTILWPRQPTICSPSSKNTALTFWYELLVENSYVECITQRTVAKIDSSLEKLSSFRLQSKPREARKPTRRLFFHSDPPSFIHRHQIDTLFLIY